MAGVMTAGICRANKIFRAAGENLFFVDRVNAAFFADQKRRATPYTDGAQGKGGSNSASVANAASSNHGFRLHCIDDLRDQWKIADCSRVSTRFVTLRDDNIGAFARMAKRVLDRTGQRHHFDATLMGEWYDFRRVTKTDDQNRHVLFKNNFELLTCRG